MDSRDIIRVLLAEDNEVPLCTAGLSMGQAIRGGEAVIIRAVPAPAVRFGDVIVFERAGLWVCHRVVRVRRGATGPVFVTKGDAVLGFDDAVPAAAVLGRVVRVRGPGGDCSLEDWRGRCGNRLLATVSLAAWLICRALPGRGAARPPGRVRRLGWRMLGVPSRLLRRRRPAAPAPCPDSPETHA